MECRNRHAGGARGLWHCACGAGRPMDGRRRPRGLPGGAVHERAGRGRRRSARRHDHHLPRHLRRRHRRRRHQRADDHQEPDAQGRGRRPRLDHARSRPARRPDPRGQPDIRNGVGDIVAVAAAPRCRSRSTSPASPSTARPAAARRVEAGVVFLDAQGTIYRSRVTNVVTSELADNADKPGG